MPQEKKGLDAALHPSLLSDNLKIVQNLYRHGDGKDTSNPYLSEPTRGKRRMVIQDDDVPVAKKTKTHARVFGLEMDNMDTWDEKFYQGEEYAVRGKYTAEYGSMGIEDDSEDEDDDEDLPSVRFIHHPRLLDIEPVSVKKEEVVDVDDVVIGSSEYLLLSKPERMKLKRQQRKKERMEKYRKVATGEIPKDALNNDKLSIKKIQNVLMNDKTIEDASKFEYEAKQKIEARKIEHDLINKQRHEEALKKKQEQDTPQQSMIQCRVFEIHNLSNPKIRFQINTMAKQMKFFGCCVRLRTDIQKGKGIIVLLSMKKNLLDKFENKMNKFKEVYDDDVKNFEIVCKWTAPLSRASMNIDAIINRKIWFMREFTNEESMKKELNKHGLLKFWNL